MSLAAVIIIALLQGVTELFPVSSLGHAVVLPAILGLAIDQRDPSFLPFLVVLHLGTAAALLLYFWRDWYGILRALIGLGRGGWRDRLRPIELIVIATIPAVVIGFVLEKPLRELFGKPSIAAALLIANGALLFGAERLRRRREASAAKTPADTASETNALTRRGALLIGLWQCLAFLPGLSRSGATLVGGLAAGLSHRAAAHFSFLIATPVILGAGVLEIPKLMRQSVSSGTMELAVIGGVIAGVAAFLSTAFLMRYFRRHEFKALDPFAGYCAALGIVSLAILALR
jgi:undecaprenyl-diphosphatase